MKRTNIQGLKISLFAVLLSTPLLAVPSSTYADTQDRVCDNLPAGQREECLAANQATFLSLVDSILNVLSWAIGIISVLMLIIAGFMYVLSAGDPEKAKRAKNTILYAVVGIVIAFAAQAVVQFVLSSV